MFSTSLVEMSLSDSECAPPQQAVFSGNSTFSRPGGGQNVIHEMRLQRRFAARPLVLFRKMWRGRVYMQP